MDRTFFRAAPMRYNQKRKSTSQQNRFSFSSTFLYAYFTTPCLQRTIQCIYREISFHLDENIFPNLQELRHCTSANKSSLILAPLQQKAPELSDQGLDHLLKKHSSLVPSSLLLHPVAKPQNRNHSNKENAHAIQKRQGASSKA